MSSTSIIISATIRDGTLGDTACITELNNRRDNFATEPEFLPDIRDRVLAIFDTAIATDVPTAINEGQPVFVIFQRALEAVGLLYLENAQRVVGLVSAEPIGAKRVGGSKAISVQDRIAEHHEESDIEAEIASHDEDEDEVKEESNESALEFEEDKDIHKAKKRKKPKDVKKVKQADRLAAAAALRRKRRLLTHGSPRKIARFSNSPGTRHVQETDDEETSIAPPVNTPKSSRRVTPRTSTFNSGGKKTPASRTSSRKTPNHPVPGRSILKLKVPNLSTLSQSVNHPRAAAQRAKYGRAPKNAEFVVPNSSSSSNEPAIHPSKDPTPSKLVYSTQPPQPRRSAITTSPSAAHPLHRNPTSPNEGWETETAASSSLSALSSAPPTPPKPGNHPAPSSFPPFPKLAPKAVEPFHRGACIALENMLADHLDEPEESLQGIVEELEGEMPTVNDWEHRTVLKGGMWVYGVMRGVWEEVEGVKGGKGGKGKGMEFDIEGLVGGMMKWVEGEWARLERD
ncbi:hypothetical protein EJ02DRAFT_510025 [Clathrospora elynae]|uniref:Uncharacterized protein n=1 Tax=Clathrospora elynae TaxID=706981 RepID=A0A6A5SXZ7_9PLEO|nr:hypothetical protein EJ02DRAFT_510025 [Clathrospora elynae]